MRIDNGDGSFMPAARYNPDDSWTKEWTQQDWEEHAPPKNHIWGFRTAYVSENAGPGGKNVLDGWDKMVRVVMLAVIIVPALAVIAGAVWMATL